MFNHVPDTGPGGAPEPYEADVIQTTDNVSLNMDQTMLYGTVGITDRVDVSVAIPLVSVRMGVTSNANIIRVSGPTFTIPGVGTFSNPHQFNSDPNSLTNSYSSNGSGSGIGDVTFRVKGNVWRGNSLAVALAMDVRTPTGSARELLGSGATGIKPFVVVSTVGKRFSPHLNVGYQWNGESILAGDVTGTTVSEDSTGTVVMKNGPAIKNKLPSQLFYTLGADVGATKRLTLSFDYLGQALFNAPRVSVPLPSRTMFPAVPAPRSCRPSAAARITWVSIAAPPASNITCSAICCSPRTSSSASTTKDCGGMSPRWLRCRTPSAGSSRVFYSTLMELMSQPAAVRPSVTRTRSE